MSAGAGAEGSGGGYEGDKIRNWAPLHLYLHLKNRILFPRGGPLLPHLVPPPDPATGKQ